MKFGPDPRPRAAQDRAVVPMINVVFLLLIFFLMSATLAPPSPFDVAPPTADGAETDPLPATLHVGQQGELAFGDARGDAVWPVLAVHEGPLPLRVDAGWPAADLAALLVRLSEAGLAEVQLLTVRP